MPPVFHSMHQPHTNFLADDDLFDQVIAMQIDQIDGSLSSEHRQRTIDAVKERMQAEIFEHLAIGDLQPAIVNAHIQQQVIAVLNEDPGSIAA